MAETPTGKASINLSINPLTNAGKQRSGTSAIINAQRSCCCRPRTGRTGTMHMHAPTSTAIDRVVAPTHSPFALLASARKFLLPVYARFFSSARPTCCALHRVRITLHAQESAGASPFPCPLLPWTTEGCCLRGDATEMGTVACAPMHPSMRRRSCVRARQRDKRKVAAG